MKKNFGTQSWLYPMPVLIISAYDENDVPCAMNAAWGMISSADKISMCLSPGHKTVKDILLRKAFTVSIGDQANMVQCDYVGIVSANDVPDKIARAGWTVTKSEFVDAPVINELSMELHCELLSYDEESHIMVGKIVNVSADEEVLTNGKPDIYKVNPISYDPVNHKYLVMGEETGNAFADGAKLK